MNWHDLSGILSKCVVSGSAPCRVDCGGSTDHRLTALLCRQWRPATTNIALELRSSVRLEPYTSGRIAVESVGLGQQEMIVPNITFQGSFGFIFAIMTHFGVHGVRVIIESQLPPCSGLGVSGAIAVTIIGALLKIFPSLTKEQYSLSQIVLLAHNIEDSLYGNTGLQDQAAAVYGGVNLWEWKYGSNLDFVRQKLQVDPFVLEKHMLLAYTGKPHPASQEGSAILNSIRHSTNGDTLSILSEISQMGKNFAKAIQSGLYGQAGRILLAEMLLRSRLVPALLTPDQKILLRNAESVGCGAKSTGYGGGGCIWAVGTEESISDLKQQWEKVFHQGSTGFLLPVIVAQSGLQISVGDQSLELDDSPSEPRRQRSL